MPITEFGPRRTPEEAARSLIESERFRMQALPADRLSLAGMLCNCRGPQPGETKCPRALAAEMQQGHDMIANGVVIGGRKYRLVPDA